MYTVQLSGGEVVEERTKLVARVAEGVGFRQRENIDNKRVLLLEFLKSAFVQNIMNKSDETAFTKF